MVLLWPWALVLLGIIPLLVALYFWIQRRRRRFTVRYSSLALVREAGPQSSKLRRYLPLALFLLALASLVVALARPAAIVTIPTNQTTIILTIDVSGSMRFRDIQPNRLMAAEAAAMSFIQKQKSQTQIGVVAFSGFAELIQPPTTDQQALESAVESLTTGRATAIGSGILESIDAIAQIDNTVAPSVTDSSGVAPQPVPKGAYAPDIIVLLTDGVSNTGIQPLDAAQQAVDRGIRIYTIGFGTAEGPSGSDPFGFGGQGGFGGGQGQGNNNAFPRFRRGIDETTLKQIADMTGGHYYAAASAGELQKVFQELPTYLIAKHGVNEISVAFAALGALLAAVAVILAMLWRPLPG